MRYSVTAVFILIGLAVQACYADEQAATSVQLRSRKGRPVTDETLRNLSAPDLTSLHVSSDKVTNEGLKSLERFDQLQRLILDRTSISDEGLKHLARLRNLHTLMIRLTPTLSENGLRQFSGLTKLRKLEYSGKITGKGFAYLNRCDQLSSLGFRADRLNAVELGRLAQFKQLKSITIIGGVIDDPAMARIAAVPHLEYLSLVDTQLEGKPVARLGRCEDLVSLSFRNMQIKDGDLKHVARLSKLRYLTLYMTEVTSDGISILQPLKQLVFLNLSYSQRIDDEILTAIEKLVSLEEIYLNGTGVSKVGGTAIRQTKPVLNVEHVKSRPRE